MTASVGRGFLVVTKLQETYGKATATNKARSDAFAQRVLPQIEALQRKGLSFRQMVEKLNTRDRLHAEVNGMRRVFGSFCAAPNCIPLCRSIRHSAEMARYSSFSVQP